ncbi:hypothetical protein Y032_0116g588 [Ancylostoma ceylanicum]|uniref:7TM GPCR serpentine receptor class x (Srx) domain-containing protein n=1 Tax=Ancylostoma ceylanicum TaxID=53326 RepID=A0A016TCJ2_9BILA|nr:hypothetical protein Y032_0116g588 [Ancylostoma ceylanicum]
MRKGLNTIRPAERQLLAQAAILFLVLTSLLTCWHHYQLFLPDTIWTLFSVNIYWIVYCGLKPLLHMAFSRKIRTSFLLSIGIKFKKKNYATASVFVASSAL